MRELVEAGWTAVDANDNSAAARLFKQAIAKEFDHAVANYGLGYVLVQQGRSSEARGPLCRALPRANTTDRRHIEQMLTQIGMSCR